MREGPCDLQATLGPIVGLLGEHGDGGVVVGERHRGPLDLLLGVLGLLKLEQDWINQYYNRVNIYCHKTAMKAFRLYH